jgi:hypothetical protein
MSKPFFLRTALIATLTMGFLSGCSNGGTAQFIPHVESAEEALDIALQAWKSGKPLKPIEDVDPVVQPVESRWQTGQKLLSYEILKEIPSEDSKQFQVRLKLAGRLAPEETIFVVLGKDPLYVYWKPDLDKSSQSM